MVILPKQGYKQTEVVIIPEDWEYIKLKELVVFGNQGVNTAIDHVKYVENGIPMLKAGDINQDFSLETTDKISLKSFQNIPENQKPKKMDILYANIGSQLGGCILVNFTDKVAIAWNVFIMRLNKKIVPKYLLFFLNQSLIRNRLKNLATQSTMPFIPKTILLSTLIILPSLEEQQKIAKVLSDTDELIKQLDYLIEKKKNIKQGAMQELLTGKRRLSGFSGKWESTKLGKVVEMFSGGTPSTFIPEYWNGSIRWMNSGELNLRKVYEVRGRITELGLKKSSSKKIPKNCILIGLAGQGKTRGTVAINYVELCINQSICAIFPNKYFIPEYLYYNLDSRYDELRNLSTGEGGRGGLNLTIIRNIGIPFPPTIEEQSAIAKILLDMDVEIEELEKNKEKYIMIKNGMMQKLLTGEIRLK